MDDGNGGRPGDQVEAFAQRHACGIAHVEWSSSSVRWLRGTAAENRVFISAIHAEIIADAEIGRYIHRDTCGVN